MANKLGCVHLRWSATDEEGHNAVIPKERNSTMERNVGEWIGVEPYRAIRSVVNVVRGNYGIPALSRALLWPYHVFYISRLYRDDLLRHGSIQCEE